MNRVMCGVVYIYTFTIFELRLGDVSFAVVKAGELMLGCVGPTVRLSIA